MVYKRFSITSWVLDNIASLTLYGVVKRVSHLSHNSRRCEYGLLSMDVATAWCEYGLHPSPLKRTHTEIKLPAALPSTPDSPVRYAHPDQSSDFTRFASLLVSTAARVQPRGLHPTCRVVPQVQCTAAARLPLPCTQTQTYCLVQLQTCSQQRAHTHAPPHMYTTAHTSCTHALAHTHRTHERSYTARTRARSVATSFHWPHSQSTSQVPSTGPVHRGRS